VTVAGTLGGAPSALRFGGQALDASAAVVTVNGRGGLLADLQPGVTIRGKATRTGTGLHLENADVRPSFWGPVSAVDVAGGKLTVLGTVVTVDALTVLVQQNGEDTFLPLTLADIKVGDMVRVFGSVQADGSFLATRVERRTAEPPDGDELRGTVAGLNTSASTFTLGPLTVAYGTATVRGTLVNGAQVEVEGTLSGTTFTATRVVVEDDSGDDEEAEVELSGLLSHLDPVARTFELFTFKVDYSAARVEGTLAEGARVEVEGRPGASATILATRVEVETVD